MGLLSNPVILSDGTANHTFSFKAQRFDTKNTVGDYIEDAASAESQSILTAKHDTTKETQRHLLQRSVYLTPAADAESDPLRVTINTTITCSKKFTHTEIQPQLNIHTDAMAEANFLRNFLNGMI